MNLSHAVTVTPPGLTAISWRSARAFQPGRSGRPVSDRAARVRRKSGVSSMCPTTSPGDRSGGQTFWLKQCRNGYKMMDAMVTCGMRPPRWSGQVEDSRGGRTLRARGVGFAGGEDDRPDGVENPTDDQQNVGVGRSRASQIGQHGHGDQPRAMHRGRTSSGRGACHVSRATTPCPRASPHDGQHDPRLGSLEQQQCDRRNCRQ